MVWCEACTQEWFSAEEEVKTEGEGRPFSPDDLTTTSNSSPDLRANFPPLWHICSATNRMASMELLQAMQQVSQQATPQQQNLSTPGSGGIGGGGDDGKRKRGDNGTPQRAKRNRYISLAWYA